MVTERLQLVPATLSLCDAEASGQDAVARALGALVPPSWPPPVLEPDDVDRIRRRLESDPRNHTWTLHYVVRRPSAAGGRPELVGVAGYAGPPTPGGAVEIGYAVAVEHQRHGYATEAVTALVARAFADPGVSVVFATTYATLQPSIHVLRKVGFVHVASDPQTGLLRYERRRPAPSSGDAAA